MADFHPVVSSGFCSSSETVLHLFCRTWSDTHIKNAEDESLLFTLESPIFRSKLVLRYAEGSIPLLCIKQKSWSGARAVFRGESESEESLLFTVNPPRLFQRSSNLRVFLAATDSDSSPDYEVIPASFSDPLRITRHGEIVATVKYKFSFFRSKPDYIITVYPGVDKAFIVSLVCIHIELQNEHTN